MLRGQMNERCPFLDDVPPHAPWLPGHSGTAFGTSGVPRRLHARPLPPGRPFRDYGRIVTQNSCDLQVSLAGHAASPVGSWEGATAPRHASGVQERRRARDASGAT